MRAGPLANRVACTRALLPAGVSLCVSASASAFASSLWQLWHPHTAMQAHGSLVCEQAARKLAAREWYGGGSGAARRLRGSGATVARQRRGSGAAATSARSCRCEGRAGWAWAAQCVRSCWRSMARRSWCSDALPARVARGAAGKGRRPSTAVWCAHVARWLCLGRLVARTLALPLGVCSGATCEKQMLSTEV